MRADQDQRERDCSHWSQSISSIEVASDAEIDTPWWLDDEPPTESGRERSLVKVPEKAAA